MIETWATIIVTSVSLLLFGYWFRYVCLLILAAKPPRDYARGVAIANDLGFRVVQEALRRGTARNARSLQTALNRDFRVLSYLLKHAGRGHDDAIETRMLRIDYWAMDMWCWTSSWVSPPASRRALQEMALIVAHFASILAQKLASLRC